MGARLIIPSAVGLGHLPPPDSSPSPLPSSISWSHRENNGLYSQNPCILTSTQDTAGPKAPWATHPGHRDPERARAWSLSALHTVGFRKKETHTLPYAHTKTQAHRAHPRGPTVPPGSCEVSAIRPRRRPTAA